ncbi:MAG: response regulator transcription factor [Burkholderiales bacterium]
MVRILQSMETTHSIPTRQGVRTFLVEDSAPFRERLIALITAGEEICVVGISATVETAIEEILALKPAVVILDIHLQDGNGMRVIREVKKLSPGIEFVVLTNHPEPLYRMAFAKMGACGFLDKSHDFGRVKAAVLAAGQYQTDQTIPPVPQR